MNFREPHVAYDSYVWNNSLGKKATIHQLTTMLSTCKNGLFPGYNHLLITGAYDPTLWLSSEHQHG